MKDSFDAVIIGAGINGCAIARKLSLEGKRVLLLEKETIGCGTSSNSSKLIHGGLGYLENLQFGLAKESLQERRRLMELYPDLVQMVPFYLPVYSDSPRPWWMIRAGLALYNFYSHQEDFRSRVVRFTDFANHFPEMNLEELEKVYVYYDGKTDYQELTRRIARDAVDRGCSIIENIRLTDVRTGEDGVRIKYKEGQVKMQASAPVLVNAAGSWIDEVNDRFGLEHHYRLKKVSGVRIVVSRKLARDCILVHTGSRRIFFMIPRGDGKTIIGTTERDENGPVDSIKPAEEDITYLLNCANHYLSSPLGRMDVESAFVGPRSLIYDKESTGPARMKREYKLDLVVKGRSRILHVYGGRLTTCLSLADQAARILYA